MSKVEIGKGRAKINDTMNGLEIVIPSKKSFFTIAFIPFWLVGWLFGEVTVIGTLFRALFVPSEESAGAPSLFMLVWLILWTVGGAFAIYTLLWNIKGKEIISVNSGEISYKKDLFGFGKSREYTLAEIKNMRVIDKPSGPWGAQTSWNFWGFSGGTIGFDYGLKTYKIVNGIDEAEAKHIIDEISQRFQISVKKEQV